MPAPNKTTAPSRSVMACGSSKESLTGCEQHEEKEFPTCRWRGQSRTSGSATGSAAPSGCPCTPTSTPLHPDQARPSAQTAPDPSRTWRGPQGSSTAPSCSSCTAPSPFCYLSRCPFLQGLTVSGHVSPQAPLSRNPLVCQSLADRQDFDASQDSSLRGHFRCPDPLLGFEQRHWSFAIFGGPKRACSMSPCDIGPALPSSGCWAPDTSSRNPSPDDEQLSRQCPLSLLGSGQKPCADVKMGRLCSLRSCTLGVGWLPSWHALFQTGS
mmetsp:Transcript_246/g.627  ORF Transcript_246/g.627 Transcript_246/m.627 type:complete len:268 (-) Transcript_246:156-959(-)